MKTFSVEEASMRLSELVKSASEGEEIAKSESQLSSKQAETYLREVRAERLGNT